MDFVVEIPRNTYDGLCSFLQRWGQVYSQPNAIVLRGSLYNPFSDVAEQFNEPRAGAGSNPGGATRLAAYYLTALHALGRAKVQKTCATLDLRDLEEEEEQAFLIAAQVATLRPSQRRTLTRLANTARQFMNLPAMVRIALAAK